MQNIFTGTTDYSNQSNKEIIEDFIKLVKYTKKILRRRKRHSRRENIPMDLDGIFNEITLFAERLIELSNENLKKLKRGKPPLLFAKSLQEIGRNAHQLFLRIGEIWHGKYNQINYSSRYTDIDIATIEYAEFRDYMGLMIDLNNIGFELQKRYFQNGKPLYSEKKWWEVIIRIFFDAVLEILRKIGPKD